MKPIDSRSSAWWAVPGLGGLLALAACTPPAAPGAYESASATTTPASEAADTADPDRTTTLGSKPATAAETPALDPRDREDRTSRYTLLSGCAVIASKPEEAGYRMTECAGPAGYALRRVEADARDNLLLRAPGADFASLRMPGLVDGAFSTVQERVEWRGARRGDTLAPDALIARYSVADDPDDGRKETSYLVVARLSPPGPCVVGLVDPGAGQNQRARDLADGSPDCLQR